MRELECPRLFHFKPLSKTNWPSDTPLSSATSREPVFGAHREICIRPGLWMSLINFTSSDHVSLAYEKQFPSIDFGFVISGNIQRNLNGPNPGPDPLQIQNGISGTRLEARQSGTFMVPAHHEQQILHIHMTLPFFRQVVKDESNMLPKALRDALKGDSKAEFTSIKPMAPDIQSVVYQLLNTSSNAYPWSLYLEGKSLELLSLHLAAMTGLTVAKLQAGFTQEYGMSVFDYFREYRMEKARQLLSQPLTNVSETAWQVGYVNVSHFSAAFKKRFGILPKHYLKMHRV
ncbi:MAG: helix-turn-helix transcriptional regulator [Desulfobacter sp.]|nr:MAG: helix-turn-helix transcriptional regulator [Desulfobacter sp.]